MSDTILVGSVSVIPTEIVYAIVRKENGEEIIVDIREVKPVINSIGFRSENTLKPPKNTIAL